MNYTKIDLSTWKRGTLFKFYIDKMRSILLRMKPLLHPEDAPEYIFSRSVCMYREAFFPS